ncbi:EPT/RTPC-like protein [Cryphonectria parasitica EP155]|uniref:EPT/RTPC-like protein n=1 Tax=Cryphonectria parasitica (strain ATCC 38755 / EP155) TaxID=660469 RepID=A0A9P5CSB7_CRYP1|nr:EPT/RTPC-like protein [Cryphonectria parasitica EP155]KAF3769143.1 EPT/RTPC-like protein [Cryphonectria parasitica EP155]
MKSPKMIELDGRTGEGGGQLVRIAIALASVTSKPVRITNVRGNRSGPRGGGLKSQHVTSVEWLAKATNADVKGLDVGSKTLEFCPKRGPGDLLERNIKIYAESPAASALLILQAVFPFLLFAGNESGDPVELTISGGTNVSFSLSYEYLDQVVLPTLEAWFSIRVQRNLESRGWSAGPKSRGSLWFKIHPLPLGTTLKLKDDVGTSRVHDDLAVQSVDATIITPAELHGSLESILREDLTNLFPQAELNFKQPEDSRHESRIYVLLVAKSETLRWGRDCLYSGKRKGKGQEKLCKDVSRAVTKALADEQAGVVDEYLQDQLVIFQALAEGRTSFPRWTTYKDWSEACDESISGVDEELEKLHMDGGGLKRDRVRGPLGDVGTDSTHTQTARWVTSEMLDPTKLTWYNKGTVCEGISLESGCSNTR